MIVSVGINDNIVKNPVRYPIAAAVDTFAPTDLAGLSLWLDADDFSSIIFNGPKVSQWTDKSTNANHAVQITSAQQPIYVNNAFNGHHALRFNGVTSNLSLFDSASMKLGNDFSMFFTYYRTSSGVGGYLMQKSTNTAAVISYVGFLTLQQPGIGDVGFMAVPDDTYFLATILRKDTPDSLYFGINGASQSVQGYVNRTLTNNINGYFIGSNSPSTSAYFGGDIANIIIYNRTLTPTERATVENYLITKYGF